MEISTNVHRKTSEEYIRKELIWQQHSAYNKEETSTKVSTSSIR